MLAVAIVSISLLAIVANSNVEFVVFAAVVVPIFYAVATKLLDFCIRWELKGRRNPGEYRFWIKYQDNSQWECRSGDIERLVALHGNTSRIAYIEQSVRFLKVNPYSLGLDLTAGAIAVDVASLIGRQADPGYVGWAILIHTTLLIGAFGIVLSNQNSPPYEVKAIWGTAIISILVGLLAMGTSFLALDAELVQELLNIRN